MPLPAEPRFQAVESVEKGGVLAALPALLQAGLLRHADGLGPLPGFYSLRSVLLLLAFLLLARVRNPEQLRYQQPGEWGRLLGLDRCCAPDTLRRKLAQLCDQPVAVQAWADQLARHWLADEQDALAALFVDGHVKVYTGQARLPKHFVSRQRLQLPADTGFWIHQRGGKPLLCLRQQVDPGMVEVMREQLLPELQQLGLLPPPAAAAPAAPALTLAFDREGWSPQLFRDLQARGVACVTWRKGRQQERWPDEEFRAAAIPLRTPFGLETGRGRIAERPLQLLEGRLTVREIRFWIDQREQVAGRSGHPRQPRRLAGRPAAEQRQPSIVTTYPTLPAAEVAGLLRSRWSQENNFKWLRQEFGLDSLPQHATEEVEPATVIANPAMRLIDKALESDKARAGRLRRQQAHWRGRRGRPAQAKRREIKAAIDAVETQIAGLQRARKSTDSHILAGELPHEIRLAALPAARRCLLDTLRLICYRAETLTATLLAPHLGKPAEVRALVKALFHSDATLRPDPAAQWH